MSFKPAANAIPTRPAVCWLPHPLRLTMTPRRPHSVLAFWGMTGAVVGTFVIAVFTHCCGAGAFEMRRELNWPKPGKKLRSLLKPKRNRPAPPPRRSKES